jgi:uncharacterized phage-like protein YoqJ
LFILESWGEDMIVAGTGHRLNRLGYGAEVEKRLEDLAIAALKKVKATRVITGMAVGWDMALARGAMALELPFVAAVPCLEHDSRWSAAVKAEYQKMLSNASEVVLVSNAPFSSRVMQIRNEWLVDRCEMLLALWNGDPSGTGNCVKYAQGKVPIKNLWATWERYKNAQVQE